VSPRTAPSADRRKVEAEVMMMMIGIAGTVILLPLAAVGLAFGLVRFALNALRAVFEVGVEKVGHRLAFLS
jgi:predicted transcriptional regulator